MKNRFFFILQYLLMALFLGPFYVYGEEGSTTSSDDPGNISYSVELNINAPGEIATMIRETSRLVSKKEEGVASLSAMNRRIRADIEAFNDILRSEGFYAGRVTQRVLPGNQGYQITLSVETGPRYVVTLIDIVLSRAEADLPGKLLEGLPLKVGAAARAEDIVISERALISALAVEGYPLAVPLPREVVVDHAGQEVQVTYAVDAGGKVSFGRVVYEGLISVKASYLDEFITWQAGEVYNQRKVDAFRGRLVGSGLFRSVSIRLDPLAATSEGVLVVSVEEGPMRTVAIGAGYSTNEGFGAEVSWEHRNIFGAQERLRLQATGSEIEQSFSAFFTKPHFRRLDQNLNLRTKFGREDTDAFDKVALEGYAGLERKLTPRKTATLGIKGEILSIQENGNHDEYFILSLPLTLFWDASDDALDPTRGFKILTSIQPSLSLIEENFPYLLIENRASAYWGLGPDNKVVFAIRARLGSTVGPATLRLPASERFFAGGGGSVRGFGFQDIGPRDIFGDPTGGRSVAEIGFEVRTRVSKTIGIVPFIEGGNVYSSKFPKFTGFQWGAGLGLRYYTAVAPIRLDIAFPINKRPGDANVQIYISFGQSF